MTFCLPVNNLNRPVIHRIPKRISKNLKVYLKHENEQSKHKQQIKQHTSTYNNLEHSREVGDHDM